MHDQRPPRIAGPIPGRTRDVRAVDSDLSDDLQAADIPEVWKEEVEDEGLADPEHARRLAAVRTELLQRSQQKPTSGE